MPQILSHRNIRLVLNGYRITGWAQEDQPVEFGNPELFTVEVGPDGTLYATDTGVLGGELTIRLNPSSRSVQWCLQERQKRRRGSSTYYSGTYSDVTTNKVAKLEGGVFVSCPAMAVPQVTFEAMFHFEVINADVDGAAFIPPPSTTI